MRVGFALLDPLAPGACGVALFAYEWRVQTAAAIVALACMAAHMLAPGKRGARGG